jgi:outer membrane protein assembly factor BamB
MGAAHARAADTILRRRYAMFRASIALALAPLAPPLLAQDPTPAAQEAPRRDDAALAAAFERQLTGATLVGNFVDDTQAQPALKEERYTLGEVRRQPDGRWRFEAQIEYGGKSATVPLVLNVEWAGDTPVITLTDYWVPGFGTFTARVLFHGDRYVGVWDGGDHGGTMFGKVERAASDEAPAAAGGGEDDEAAAQWPSFRGYRGRGIHEGYPTPVEWDVAQGKNVLWRTELAGLAHSSPVVWGDHVFLTTAVREGGKAQLKVGLYGSIEPVEHEGHHLYRVLCLDKRTGEVRWSRTAWAGIPAIKRHPKGSHAASSAATDGEHVVAFFGGEGLYCYTVEGEPLWSKDFGVLDSGFFMDPSAQWGFSASPVIERGKVIVQCDVQGQSFLAALDVRTGEQLWRTDREEECTWSTPTVHVADGRAQVLCNGWKHIGGYDLETGAELWKLEGGGDIPVPTPVVAHGNVYITNAHGRLAPIYAVKLDARGLIDIEHEDMAWANTRRGNYMQTPLVYGDYLYCCHDSGVLRCYDARTGEERYTERLSAGGGGFTASCIVADGKLYATSEDGEVFVIKAGPEFELLATNTLGEEAMASPAASEGVLFWRTREHLTAFALDARGK